MPLCAVHWSHTASKVILWANVPKPELVNDKFMVQEHRASQAGSGVNAVAEKAEKSGVSKAKVFGSKISKMGQSAVATARQKTGSTTSDDLFRIVTTKAPFYVVASALTIAEIQADWDFLFNSEYMEDMTDILAQEVIDVVTLSCTITALRLRQQGFDTHSGNGFDHALDEAEESIKQSLEAEAASAGPAPAEPEPEPVVAEAPAATDDDMAVLNAMTESVKVDGASAEPPKAESEEMQKVVDELCEDAERKDKDQAELFLEAARSMAVHLCALEGAQKEGSKDKVDATTAAIKSLCKNVIKAVTLLSPTVSDPRHRKDMEDSATAMLNYSIQLKIVAGMMNPDPEMQDRMLQCCREVETHLETVIKADLWRSRQIGTD